jgi:hypothetical protein
MRSRFLVFHALSMAPILVALSACGGMTDATSDAGPPNHDGDASARDGECSAPSLSGVPAPTVKQFDAGFPVPASPGGPIVSGTYVLTEVDEYGPGRGAESLPAVMVIDSSAGTIAETWRTPDAGTDGLVGTYSTSNSYLSASESPSCGPAGGVSFPYAASGTQILLYAHKNGDGILWTYERQ